MSRTVADPLMKPKSAAAKDEADSILDEIHDGYLRGKLRDAKPRIDFAMIAANIAEDRYSAGSTAALVTTYIALKWGFQSALDFAADLSHHEN